MMSAEPASRGFVLVATLWAVAGLTVLASYVNDVTVEDVEAARLAKESLAAELRRRSTEATLLYLLATNRVDHRAVLLATTQRFAYDIETPLPVGDEGRLTLSGEPYVAFEKTRFALQDEGGLVSVNDPTFPAFAAALRYAGVPSQEVQRIVHRTTDYIDLGQSLSLNGAERFDYVRRGLSPPPNWFMASPLELKKVLGVDTLVDAAAWRRLRPLLTSRIVFGYNFNTMPVEGLVANLAVAGNALEPLLEARERQPVSGLRAVERLTGRPANIDPQFGSLYPSSNLRITTWSKGSRRQSVLGISLTPASVVSPWRTEYRYTEPIYSDAGTLRRPPTPLLWSF